MPDVTGLHVGKQAGADDTFFAAWSWNGSNLDKFYYLWFYITSDGLQYQDGGYDSSSVDKYTKLVLYNAPSNAIAIRCAVRPISETYKVNDTEVSYWNAWYKWSSWYYLKDNFAPATLSAPDVEIDKLKLTATIDNIDDVRCDQVQFEVYSGTKKVKSGTASVTTARAIYTCTISVGNDYRVRCRPINVIGKKKLYGDWSDYSSSAATIPAAPKSITSLKALSSTSIEIKWDSVTNATSYKIEYTTDKSYFDTNTSAVSSVTIEVGTTAQVTGITSGSEYFFRVAAVNKTGESSWTAISSVILGKAPIAPTTWSSTTTATIGDPLNLYWVHNSEDGSSQTYAQLEIRVGGSEATGTVTTIKNSTEEDEKDKTSVYAIDTTKYSEGTKIVWRVRTRGVLDSYGEWSILRTIDVYAKPNCYVNVLDKDLSALDTLVTFPFTINAVTYPDTQTSLGYYVAIISKDQYVGADYLGNEKTIKVGDVVFSKYLNSSEDLDLEILPSMVTLQDGMDYTISVTAYMDSGLNATGTVDLSVSYSEESTDYRELSASVLYDEQTYTTSVNPQCLNSRGRAIQVDNISLAVYRREFDGTFTELATGITNTVDEFVADPHPALDYARYRVVATSTSTGAVTYMDVPGYPIKCYKAILQWDEAWVDFNTAEPAALAERPWSGSLIALPYNIDVSDNSDPDTTLINYIGRSFPIAYYGTQVGSTSTWNMDVPITDEDTLYALRRLQRWMGDVYVREPSGSGYWANVKVSFSRKHTELVMPVTLNITRVEGESAI